MTRHVPNGGNAFHTRGAQRQKSTQNSMANRLAQGIFHAAAGPAPPAPCASDKPAHNNKTAQGSTPESSDSESFHCPTRARLGPGPVIPARRARRRRVPTRQSEDRAQRLLSGTGVWQPLWFALTPPHPPRLRSGRTLPGAVRSAGLALSRPLPHVPVLRIFPCTKESLYQVFLSRAGREDSPNTPRPAHRRTHLSLR